MVTVSTLRPSGLVSDTVTTMSSILFVLTQCGCPARPQHKDQDASPLRWWVPQCKIIKCLVTFLDWRWQFFKGHTTWFVVSFSFSHLPLGCNCILVTWFLFFLFCLLFKRCNLPKRKVLEV
jgi:hypothetical protein